MDESGSSKVLINRPFKLGEAEVDPALGTIAWQGEARHVEPKAMEVLLALAERPGEIVTRDELLDRVWTGSVVVDASVTRCISQLRAALGDDRVEPRCIQTVQKRGYRLLQAPQPLDRPVPAIAASARWSRRVTGLAAAAALAIIAIVLGMLRTAEEPAASPAIAVLPFANMTGDENQQYLADGLTEELITRLSRIEGMNVAARTSSHWAHDQGLEVREIAERLQVDSILEGSIRRYGQRIKVTAQLIDGRTGMHLWSEDFDRKQSDLIAVQEAIARGIAQKVYPRAGASQKAIVRATPELEAYDLYLLASQLLNRYTRESVKKAVELLERAVLIEPDFAPAWGKLAEAHILSNGFGLVTIDAAGPRALAAGEKAIELDPDSPDALVGYGRIVRVFHPELTVAERYQRALKAYEKALALDPNHVNAHVRYGDILFDLNRFEEALSHYRKVAELDPLSAQAHSDLAWGLLMTRQLDEAELAIVRAIELAPQEPTAWMHRARLHEARGELVEAIRANQRAHELNPNNVGTLGAIAAGYLDLEKPDEAEPLLRKAIQLAPHHPFPRLQLLFYLWQKGEFDRIDAISREAIKETDGEIQGISRYIALARLLAGDCSGAVSLMERALEKGVTETVFLPRFDNPAVDYSHGWMGLHILAECYRLAGEAKKARDVLHDALAELHANPPDIPLPESSWHHALAVTHAMLGNEARAIQALEDAIDAGWYQRWRTLHLPFLETLHDHSGFTELMAQLDTRLEAERRKLDRTIAGIPTDS